MGAGHPDVWSSRSREVRTLRETAPYAGAALIYRLKLGGGFPLSCRLKGLMSLFWPAGERPSGVTLRGSDAVGRMWAVRENDRFRRTLRAAETAAQPGDDAHASPGKRVLYLQRT